MTALGGERSLLTCRSIGGGGAHGNCRTCVGFTFALSYPSVPTFPKGAGLTDTSALTVKDVADMLNVDTKTVYRLAQKHDLPGFKVAGTWRFMRSDIINWIDKQKPKGNG